MIWLAVVPTLIVLNLALSKLLEGVPIVLRTLIVATIAVPIVMYGLMPRLQRVRGRLVARQPRVSAIANAQLERQARQARQARRARKQTTRPPRRWLGWLLG